MQKSPWATAGTLTARVSRDFCTFTYDARPLEPGHVNEKRDLGEVVLALHAIDTGGRAAVPRDAVAGDRYADMSSVNA